MSKLVKIWLILCSICLASCNITRYVQEDAHLLKKNVLKVYIDKRASQKADINYQLNNLIQPKPNAKLFGVFIPYKLIAFNNQADKKQGDTSLVKMTKMREKPVIYDSSIVLQTITNMNTLLFNKGFFDSYIKDTVIVRNRKAKVIYNVTTGKQFYIKDVELDIDNDSIKSIVERNMRWSNIKAGNAFSIDNMDAERARLTNIIRSQGYYKFTQNNIVSVELDTLDHIYITKKGELIDLKNFSDSTKLPKTLNPTLNVRIVIRNNQEPESYEKYMISTVTVLPDYNSDGRFQEQLKYKYNINNIQLRYQWPYVSPHVIARHVYLKPGQYFSQNRYDYTINKLNGLGLFDYVRVYLEEDTTVTFQKFLKSYVLMSPGKQYDIGANFEVSNGATYQLGTAVNVYGVNRNFLKGANQLSITVSGGIELSYDGERSDKFIEQFYLFSRNLGLSTNLTIPSFISPFGKQWFQQQQLPKTIIGLSALLQDRASYFSLFSINANYTYNWQRNRRVSWDFTPIFTNVFQLLSISQDFQDRLDNPNNEFLRKTYANNFIEGENLSYTYNNQTSNPTQNYTYLKSTFEEAGALVAGLNVVTNNGFDRQKINFSKYVKLDLDVRRHVLSTKTSLIFRGFLGLGMPYGLSQQLPYIKQYFAGGPYSLRGWRARQLGPGASEVVNNNDLDRYIDRTADIKIEGNAEYRFKVFSLFSNLIIMNGAVFLDAGNIWLAHPSEQFPNGHFQLNKFFNHLAINSGLGARFDFGSFLILRFDVGLPLKAPTQEGNNWLFSSINFTNSEWRRNNLVPSIAIGYPF